MPRSLNGRVIPLSATEHRYLWCRIRELAGCPDFRWHDARHEAVSRLFERGLRAEEVMAVSGHSSHAMVSRYLHLQTSDLVAKLG